MSSALVAKRGKFLCINCGQYGHEYRFCREPITSFGVINFRILGDIGDSKFLIDKFSTPGIVNYQIYSSKYPDITCITSNMYSFISDHRYDLYNHSYKYYLDTDGIKIETPELFEKFNYFRDRIQFLLVSRKYSLGFVDFIRGKYNIHDPNTIINLFQQMTCSEIKKIGHTEYDDLLYEFLNRNAESKDLLLNRVYEGKYSNEYCEAKTKFNILSKPEQNHAIPWSLHFYVKYVKPKWSTPEWGFPKGRRDKSCENNLECATREFQEETGYSREEYIIFDKIEPVSEYLTGTNNVHYKHVYYLSIDNCQRKDCLLNFDRQEIGEVRWFTYQEAIDNIRPRHINKKCILTRIYLFILNVLMNNSH